MAAVTIPIVLKFICAELQIVEVEEDVASVSLLLKGMVEDIRIENDEGKLLKETIPIIPVETKHLKWALQYCEHYKNIEYVEQDPRAIPKDPRTDWDKTFLDKIPNPDVPMFLEAAYYMEIPGLVDILAYRIAMYLETLTLEEMRACFGVENDYTEEEEKELRERFSWVEKTEEYQPQKKKNKAQQNNNKLLL